MTRVPDYCTWDIETVGPLDTRARTTITSICIIDNNGKAFFYREGEEVEAAQHLLAHKGMVTFNGRGFDLQILRQYVRRADGLKLRYMPHYDLFYEWVKQRRSFNSLDNFSKATLEMAKIAEGGATPAMMWRTHPKEMYRYNYWDTHLTYMLFVHVCTHGYVYANMPRKIKFFPYQIGRVA